MCQVTLDMFYLYILFLENKNFFCGKSLLDTTVTTVSTVTTVATVTTVTTVANVINVTISTGVGYFFFFKLD